MQPAHFGEMSCQLAYAHGCRGMLLAGNCRDTQYVLKMPDFPIFSFGTRPNAFGGWIITEAIRFFGGQQKIHFVHFRDIRGTAKRFVETFHDDGPTDMLEAMRCYQEIDFHGPMRPDHVPTLEGDDNATPGYTTRGRLYAIGYMRGLLEATQKGR